MKYSKEQTAQAVKQIEAFRNKQIYGTVNHVSRSGMSRRIEFHAVSNDGTIERIGRNIAIIADYPYDINKGGIRADGCGMDMVFSIISNFNYVMADKDGKTAELKAAGKRIYDDYFFNANRINSL